MVYDGNIDRFSARILMVSERESTILCMACVELESDIRFGNVQNAFGVRHQMMIIITTIIAHVLALFQGKYCLRWMKLTILLCALRAKQYRLFDFLHFSTHSYFIREMCSSPFFVRSDRHNHIYSHSNACIQWFESKKMNVIGPRRKRLSKQKREKNNKRRIETVLSSSSSSSVRYKYFYTSIFM